MWVLVRSLNRNQAIWAHRPNPRNEEEFGEAMVAVIMRRGYLKVPRNELIRAGGEIFLSRWGRKEKIRRYFRWFTLRKQQIYNLREVAEMGTNRTAKANDVIEMCIDPVWKFIEVVPETNEHTIRITNDGIHFASISGLFKCWKEKLGETFTWYTAMLTTLLAGIFGTIFSGKAWSFIQFVIHKVAP